MIVSKVVAGPPAALIAPQTCFRSCGVLDFVVSLRSNKIGKKYGMGVKGIKAAVKKVLRRKKQW